jgi:hypothetical protein
LAVPQLGAGDRVQVTQQGHLVTAQHPPDGRGVGAELAGQPDRPPPAGRPQRQDLGFQLGWGPPGAVVGSAGPIQQASLTLGSEAAYPPVGGLARHAKLGRDMGHGAVLGPLDQQQA